MPMLSTYLMYLPVGEKIDPFLRKCLLQKKILCSNRFFYKFGHCIIGSVLVSPCGLLKSSRTRSQRTAHWKQTSFVSFKTQHSTSSSTQTGLCHFPKTTNSLQLPAVVSDQSPIPTITAFALKLHEDAARLTQQAWCLYSPNISFFVSLSRKAQHRTRAAWISTPGLSLSLRNTHYLFSC